MKIAQGLLVVVAVVVMAQGVTGQTVNFDDYTFSGGFSYAAADRYRGVGIVFGRDIPVENVALLEPQNYTLFLSWGGTPPNAMILGQSTGLTMTALFYVPGTTTPGTTDHVRMLFVDTEVGSQLGVLVAYDQSHDVIATCYRSTPGNQGGYLEVAEPGIAEIYFYSDADGAEVDNLVFTTPTGPVATDQTTWGRLKALYR